MTMQDVFNQIEQVVKNILETESNFNKDDINELVKDIMKDCEYNAAKIIYEGLQEYEKKYVDKINKICYYNNVR